MQRESPTDATVTVHPSIRTNVAVVPEVSPEGEIKKVGKSALGEELQLGCKENSENVPFF